MLKTTELFEKLALKLFKAGKNEIVEGGSSKADEIIVDLSKFNNKKLKKSMRVLNIRATKEPNFPIPNTKKAFNYLQLAFIKAPILWNFDLQSHI